MAKELNLQDVFLNQSRKDRIPVTIYITNGFQFKGIVKGFDNYTVILDTDGKQNLIYKHAISTITPLRPLSLLDAFDKASRLICKRWDESTASMIDWPCCMMNYSPDLIIEDDNTRWYKVSFKLNDLEE